MHHRRLPLRARRRLTPVPRALRVCPTQGCPELTTGGRCTRHAAAADRARGSAAQRGYTGRRWRAARNACLTRDLFCTCHDTTHPHGAACLAPATVADHHPTSRRDLVAAGVTDPDAPQRLRGLCKPCHDRHTAREQPGGWHTLDRHGG